MAENNNNFALIALVAIVAVVGMVGLIMAQTGKQQAAAYGPSMMGSAGAVQCQGGMTDAEAVSLVKQVAAENGVVLEGDTMDEIDREVKSNGNTAGMASVTNADQYDNCRSATHHSKAYCWTAAYIGYWAVE